MAVTRLLVAHPPDCRHHRAVIDDLNLVVTVLVLACVIPDLVLGVLTYQIGTSVDTRLARVERAQEQQGRMWTVLTAFIRGDASELDLPPEPY